MEWPIWIYEASFAPSGLGSKFYVDPRAYARGYTLPPVFRRLVEWFRLTVRFVQCSDEFTEKSYIGSKTH
jgi:hypothetical protein